MKKTIKILVSFLIMIGILFVFSSGFNQNKKVNAFDFYEAKDFKTIEIDEFTSSTSFKMENMLGLDQLTSKGEIKWDKEAKTLTFDNVSLFQIEDPLAFDEDGNRKALINVNCHYGSNEEINLIFNGENEIINYGTAFFFGKDSKVRFSNTNLVKEGILHIHNHNCYDGTILPAIDFQNDCFNIYLGTNKINTIFTLSLTGVGGLHGYEQILKIEGKTNLFINIGEEKDYASTDDPDNYLSFDEDEEINYSAISNFYAFDYSDADVAYRPASNTNSYNNLLKVMQFKLENTDYYTAKRYFFGKFKKVANYSDYEYLLNLKPEDQGEGYTNILLTKDISYEIYESDLDRSSVIVNIRGYKRLFLNNHTVKFIYNGNSDSSQSAFFHSINTSGSLDIFGAINDDVKENKIETEFDGSDRIFTLFYVAAGKLNIMDNVILGMHEDISGSNNEYDGNVLMLNGNGICNMFRGQVYGSDTFKDSTSMVAAYLVGLITLGIGAAFNWNKSGFRGVILIYQNESNVKFRMISGIVKSFEGRVIYNSNSDGDVLPWRYYGGQIASSDASGLFGYGYYNNEFIECNNTYTQFPNEKQIVYIKNGNNYLANTANMDEAAYKNDNYMYSAKEWVDYNGIYQISQMQDMVCAESIRYLNSFYAPYIDKDLPDDIYVSKDSAELNGYGISLFNLRDGVEDCTMGKGYKARLFVQLPNEAIIEWNSSIGRVESGRIPYNSLGHFWKDGQLVLVVRSTFPKEYSGTKVFFIIENNYLKTSVMTNTATINAVEEITKPVIELKAPADCFNKEPNPGYVLEMGKNDHGVNVKATIKSAYNDYVAVQWKDVTDGTDASAKQYVMLEDVDENGLHVGTISFAPLVGSTKEGTHEYELWVWTYSKYNDNKVLISYSEKVRFTVEASIPEILSQNPLYDLHLIENEVGNIEIGLGDRVPENLVGFKWYYYPSYEHMVGLDSNNSENISIGTMIPTLSKEKAILSTNGYVNKLVYNLENYLTLGKTYRIVFSEYGDIPGREIGVLVTIGDNNGKSNNLVDVTYKEIKGKYDFVEEFKYDRFDAQTLFFDPTWATFSIDFSKTALNANHVFEDFYLQELNEEGNWVTIKDLNPYLFGKNYLDLFEVENANEKILSLSGDLSKDGYYYYCKVYNKADASKYAYTYPVRLSVGLNAVEPHFADNSDYVYKLEDDLNPVLTSRYVETPFVNHEKVVEYQYQYEIVKMDENWNVVYQPVSKDDLENYGILVTERELINGETELSVKMNNFLLAKELFNYIFRAKITAYSPVDSSLTDVAYSYFYWEYTEDEDYAIIDYILFNNRVDNRIEIYGDTDDGISRFKSKNGELDIKDILYLTDDLIVYLTVGLATRNDNYDFYYEYNHDSFVLFAYWIYDGVRYEMPLEELLSNNEIGDYVHYANNRIWFEKPVLDGYQSDIPFEYQNLVVFGKYYHNNNVYRTENWQISYLDTVSLGEPCFDDNNYSIELNQETGDIEINVAVSTLAYNYVLYPNYDIFQAPILAVDTGIYKAAAELSAVGMLNAYGLNYVENYYEYDSVLDKYLYRDGKIFEEPAYVFDKASAPNKFFAKFTIPHADLLRLYEHLTENQEKFITPYGLQDIYYEYTNGLREESFDELFTEDEKALLDLLWWDDIMGIYGKLDLYINQKYIGESYQEFSKTIAYEEIISLLNPIGLEQDFGYNEYGTPQIKELNVILNAEQWIGEAAPVMGDINYNWYLDDELIENTDNEAYLKVDSSNLTTKPLIYKLEYDVSYLAGELRVPHYYIKYYHVNIIPNVKNPTINELPNYEVEYMSPLFRLQVDAEVSGSENEEMYYIWTINGEKTITEEPYLDYLPDTMGEINYSCEVHSYLTYQVGEEELVMESTTPATKNGTITVVNRVINLVDLKVDEPKVGNNPSLDVMPIPIMDNDEFIGYKVVSAFWNIDESETYNYDQDYTLNVIIELKENAEWDSTILATFNGNKDATVNNISSMQKRISCKFASEEAEEINKIELSIPEFELNSLLRTIAPYETEYYKLTNSSWNSEDENLKSNKAYVLTLTLKLNAMYKLASNGKVLVNGHEEEFILKGKTITINLDYYFGYSATIKIGDKEFELTTDENSEITLSLSEEDIPEHQHFVGWYNGEELISNNPNVKYQLNDDNQILSAKFALNEYTITFQDDNGNVYETIVLHYGDEVTAPIVKKDATSEYTYTFVKWNPEIEIVTADQIYVAEFKQDKAINSDGIIAIVNPLNGKVNLDDLVEDAIDNGLGLVIKVGDQEIIFDKDTVKDQLGKLETINLLILTGDEFATGDLAKANLKNVKMVIEISLENESFKGNANIRIPLNFAVQSGETVKVYYVSPTGVVEEMNASLDGNIIAFKTSHFSTYAICVDNPNENTNPEENENPNENANQGATNKKNNAWWIILIVLLVLIGAFILVFFMLKNKKKNEEKPKDNKKVEEISDASEEKQGVVFGEKKTLNEEYALLTKEQRKLFDLIKAKALSMENAKSTEAKDAYTIYVGKEKALRLKIKKQEIVVEFFVTDENLQEIVGDTKEATTQMKVKNEEDLEKVLQAIDYKFSEKEKDE